MKRIDAKDAYQAYLRRRDAGALPPKPPQPKSPPQVKRVPPVHNKPLPKPVAIKKPVAKPHTKPLVLKRSFIERLNAWIRKHGRFPTTSRRSAETPEERTLGMGVNRCGNQYTVFQKLAPDVRTLPEVWMKGDPRGYYNHLKGKKPRSAAEEAQFTTLLVHFDFTQTIEKWLRDHKGREPERRKGFEGTLEHKLASRLAVLRHRQKK